MSVALIDLKDIAVWCHLRAAHLQQTNRLYISPRQSGRNASLCMLASQLMQCVMNKTSGFDTQMDSPWYSQMAFNLLMGAYRNTDNRYDLPSTVTAENFLSVEDHSYLTTPGYYDRHDLAIGMIQPSLMPVTGIDLTTHVNAPRLLAFCYDLFGIVSVMHLQRAGILGPLLHRLDELDVLNSDMDIDIIDRVLITAVDFWRLRMPRFGVLDVVDDLLLDRLGGRFYATPSHRRRIKTHLAILPHYRPMYSYT